MDQNKTGAFLRELRKEKGLTQEKLAEKFNVSGRTVSRWETGVNMPDISLIKEIADFYEVDIREIIDGKRKSDFDTFEDTVSKVIEYADSEKDKLSGTVTRYSVIGLIALIFNMIINAVNNSGYHNAWLTVIKIISISFIYLALVKSISFTTGRMERKTDKRKCLVRKFEMALIIAGGIALALFVIPLFMIKQVAN